MRARIIWTMMMCLAGLVPVASANDSDTERVSLTGLTTVSVVVEELSAIAKKSGLVDGDAAVRRRAPVEAGGHLGHRRTPTRICMSTSPSPIPGASLPLPYMVEVALMQEVTLPRGLKTRTPLQTATWWVNSLGMSGPDRLRISVSDKVAEFADNFVRAFRSVNPPMTITNLVIWSFGYLSLTWLMDACNDTSTASNHCHDDQMTSDQHD